MEDKLSNNEIYQILKSLEDKIVVGFKGVHDRQDKTNGNVKENTEFRIGAIAQMSLIKVLVGIFGFGTIANVILVIFK